MDAEVSTLEPTSKHNGAFKMFEKQEKKIQNLKRMCCELEQKTESRVENEEKMREHIEVLENRVFSVNIQACLKVCGPL